jgi:hypothetical protein
MTQKVNEGTPLGIADTLNEAILNDETPNIEPRQLEASQANPNL